MSFLSGANIHLMECIAEECLDPITVQCGKVVDLDHLDRQAHLVRLVLQVLLAHHSRVVRHLVQLGRRFLRVQDLDRVHHLQVLLQDLQAPRVQTHVPDHLVLLHVLGILLTSHLVRDRLRHSQRADRNTERPVTICKIKVST
jgi:hypothetical protein